MPSEHLPFCIFYQILFFLHLPPLSQFLFFFFPLLIPTFSSSSFPFFTSPSPFPLIHVRPPYSLFSFYLLSSLLPPLSHFLSFLLPPPYSFLFYLIPSLIPPFSPTSSSSFLPPSHSLSPSQSAFGVITRNSLSSLPRPYPANIRLFDPLLYLASRSPGLRVPPATSPSPRCI